MNLSAAIWGALTAAGGSMALAFIVALAVGINALTVFYVGSAVVVLERFARVVSRWRWVLVFGALASATAVWFGLSFESPDSRVSGEQWEHWLVLAVGSVIVISLAMSACWLALRQLRPTRLAEIVVAILAVGYGLTVGATGRPGLIAAPVVLAVSAALLLEWRRRRRREPRLGEGQRLFALLAVAVAASGAVAWLMSGGDSDERIAAVGAALFGLLLAGVVAGLLPMAAAGLMEMRSSVEWFIAVRYLVAKRRQVFISAITTICVVGIAAGVWLIIVVLSVMNGFEKTWRDEILGNRAHFTVHSGAGPFGSYQDVMERVRSTPGVIGASPYLDAEGMVRSDNGQIFGIRVRGIDPATVGDVTDLRSDLVSGSLEALAESHGNGDAAILIGNHLSLSLGAEVGDAILLISPYGGPPTPLGPAPRLKRFRIAGIFESSFFQYDEVYTYVNLAAAQDFRRAGDVADGIEARTTDFYRSRAVGDRVTENLDYPFFTRDWKDFFPAFFQALKTERVMMFLLLTMIMVVAAFVIVATLIMMIMEKSSDIAILKAMGAEDATIERIFAIEGTLIGLAGTALGVVAGIAVTHQLSWVQERIEAITGIDTLPASIYQFSTLPSEVDPIQVSIVAAIAMVLSLGATLLPSRTGARLDPVEALRYE